VTGALGGGEGQEGGLTGQLTDNLSQGLGGLLVAIANIVQGIADLLRGLGEKLQSGDLGGGLVQGITGITDQLGSIGQTLQGALGGVLGGDGAGGPMKGATGQLAGAKGGEAGSAPGPEEAEGDEPAGQSAANVDPEVVNQLPRSSINSRAARVDNSTSDHQAGERKNPA